jgi:hypothetical protein
MLGIYLRFEALKGLLYLNVLGFLILVAGAGFEPAAFRL